MTATLTATDYTPRAWVGCLACYNDGRLVGQWLDVDGLEDEDALDAICPRFGHEELWCFDTDNMAGGEMSPAEAAKRGRALERAIASAEEYGVPVPVALEFIDDANIANPDAWPSIGDDVGVHSADSKADYVAEWLEGIEGVELPGWLQIDWEASFDDLTSGHPVYSHEGTLYVFDAF